MIRSFHFDILRFPFHFSANEQLAKVFGKAKNGKFRVIKVSIENGEWICSRSVYIHTIYMLHKWGT